MCAFTQQMLARLIAQKEAEVNHGRTRNASLLKNNDHRTAGKQACNYYNDNEFLGGNEFDLASSHESELL